MKPLFLFAVVATAASLAAQTQFNTINPFLSNNGGNVGGGVYFDLTVNGGVSISQFDLNLGTAAGVTGSIDVYTTPGTHVGNETSAANWTLVASAPVTAAGIDQPSSAVFATPFNLTPGTHGIAICAVGHSHRYTNGIGVNEWFSDGTLTASLGAANNVCFSSSPFSPRVWNGSIYYTILPGYATRAQYGEGCGGFADYATFYEVFGPNSIDLSGTAGSETVLDLTFTGNGYLGLPGSSAWFTPTSGSLGLVDDDISPGQSLPFTLSYPGGTTNSIWIGSNGYIFLSDPSLATPPLLGDPTASPIEFVSELPRISPFWTDLDPTAGGSVHFDVDPNNQAVYITWDQVPEWNAAGPTNASTVQCAILNTGSIEFRYRSVSNPTIGTLVGFSPGNGALDPGSIDISATSVILTAPDAFVPNMVMSSDRPVEGQPLMVTIDDIPTGTVLGTLILSGTQIFPGVQPIPGLGSCFQYVGLDSVSYYIPTGSTESINFGTVPVGSFTGLSFYLQSVTLTPGVNAAGIAASNGIEWLVNPL